MSHGRSAWRSDLPNCVSFCVCVCVCVCVMSGPRESGCAIFLRSAQCKGNKLALSIRCIAAYAPGCPLAHSPVTHLPPARSLLIWGNDTDGRYASLGAALADRLRGRDLRVAFPV